MPKKESQYVVESRRHLAVFKAVEELCSLGSNYFGNLTDAQKTRVGKKIENFYIALGEVRGMEPGSL
jgi:hypothetical protein